MLHFGWFIGKGYSPHSWNQPWTGSIGSDWMEPDIYLDLARAMDRACFDYLIIEDGSFVPDVFQGSPEWYLSHAFAVPKSDPMPLVPLLGQATTHLGIVATITTSFYPPYLAARLGATLDHLTHGRVGLNIVTAHQAAPLQCRRQPVGDPLTALRVRGSVTRNPSPPTSCITSSISAATLSGVPTKSIPPLPGSSNISRNVLLPSPDR